MDFAGSVEMLQWLHANRREGYTVRAIKSIVVKGDFAMLLFLIETCGVEVPEYDESWLFWSVNEELFMWLFHHYPERASPELLEDMKSTPYTYIWGELAAFIDVFEEQQATL